MGVLGILLVLCSKPGDLIIATPNAAAQPELEPLRKKEVDGQLGAGDQTTKVDEFRNQLNGPAGIIERQKPDLKAPSPEILAQLKPAGVTDISLERSRSLVDGLSPQAKDLFSLAQKKIKDTGVPNSSKETEQFAKDLEKFEREAKQSKLPQSEIEKTYADISQILRSTGENASGANENGVRSERQRVRIAEQLMSMVAEPEKRNQGRTQNCALAGIEGLLLMGQTREPAKVTAIVKDITLRGETKMDGSMPPVIVKIDRESLRSSGEYAENVKPGTNKERFAEGIFRLAAANTYFAIRAVEHDAEGQLHYVNRADGNHLIYVRNKDLAHSRDLAKLDTIGNVDNSPGAAATTDATWHVLKQITGKDFKDRIIVSATENPTGDANHMTKVSTREELDRHLRKLEKQGRLPAEVQVHGSHSSVGDNPFKNLSRQKTAEDTGKYLLKMFDDLHVVLVTDASKWGDSKPFEIKNTWGEKFNKDLSTDELFSATGAVPFNQYLDKLHSWKLDHVKPQENKQYEVALTKMAIEIVSSYSNLKPSDSPDTFDDHESSAKRIRRLLEEVGPKDDKLTPQQERKALEELFKQCSNKDELVAIALKLFY